MEKSGPVPIPTSNRQFSPLSVESHNNRSAGRNSVEELNQEIEKLVCVGICSSSCEPPQGHRAPIAELFSSQHRRTVSTQTPSSIDSGGDSNGSRTSDDSSYPSSAEHSRPASPASPVHIISGRPSERCYDPGYGTSPEINKFLTGEPPDGCEKVKIVNEEEARRRNLSHLVLAPCPQKPCNPGFVLLPSQSSAFLPLYKNNCISNSAPESPSSPSLNQLYEKRMNDYNDYNNSKSNFN